MIGARYRLVARVGEGSEGQVWRAEDLARDGAPVAIKRLGAPPDAGWVAAAMAVRHPALAAVLDAGGDGDGGFVAMEFVEGVSLDRASPESLVAAGARLAEALDALHARGLVHGDVKPQNVIVGPEGATLVDLGLLRERSARGARPPAGTLAYLSPEALLGEATPQSDLYALGVTLTRCLGGEHPRVAPGASDEEVLASFAPDRALRPEVMARVPARLRESLAWLLAWAPEDRPPTASAWRARWLRDADGAPGSALTLAREVPLRPPRQGGHDAVRALREAAEDPSRLGAVAVGASGSGRRRALDDALRQLMVDAARRGEALDVRDELPDVLLRPTVLLRVDDHAERLRDLAERVRRRRRFAPDAPPLTLLASASERPCAEGLVEVPVAPLEGVEAQRLLDALYGARVPSSALDAWLDVTAGLAGRMVTLARRVGPAALATATRATLYAELAREPPLALPASPESRVALAALALFDGAVPRRVAEAVAGPRALAELASLGALIPRGAALHLDPSRPRGGLPNDARLAGARAVLALPPGRDAGLLAARARAHAALGDPRSAYDAMLRAAARAELPRDVALRRLREAAPWTDDLPAHQRRLAELSLLAGDAAAALDALGDDPAPEADALRIASLRRRGDSAGARELARTLCASDDPARREVGALALGRDAFDRGDLDEARRWCAREVSPAGEGSAYELQALCAYAEGDLDLADDLVERGELAASRSGDVARRHRLRAVAGMVAQRRGDALGALQLHRDARRLALAAGDLDAAAAYLVNVGGAALDAGDLGEAVRSLERALEPLAAPGRVRTLARALGNLASLLAWIGDVDAATRAAEAALDAAVESQDVVAQGFARGVLGELRRDVDALCAAAEGCASHGAGALGAELRARATACALELGDLPRARALLPAGDGAMVRLAALALALVEDAPLDALRAARARCDVAVEADPSAEHALWRLRLVEEVARRCGEADSAAALRSERGARARALAATLPPALARTFSTRWAPESLAESPGDSARWRRLAAVTQELNGEAKLPALLERIMDAVIELTGAERGMLLLRDDDGALSPTAARDLGGETLSEGERAFSRSVAERAASAGEPLVTFDAASDARFDAAVSVAAMRLRSILAAPLRVRDEVVGVVYVDDRLRAGAFDRAAVAVVTAFADAAALAIHNARARSALEGALRRAERLSEELDEVVARQRAELEVAREARDPDGVRGSYPEIVGRGPAMARVLAMIDRVAPTSMPVLILGESGTGKELVARAVHANSPRSRAAFVAENCGAIPETLLESVLFGHVKGAFTGADRARGGLFEAADGGTLFLDEIGEMSLAMQSRLLRVLQEGEVRPVGGDRVRRVDVRVIAATHRDLLEMVRAGRFREDLYYRLAVLVLRVPGLRERREDIPALVAHFLARHGGGIERSALARLVAAPWQGNVRELENVVRRAAVMAPGGTIREHDLGLPLSGAAPPAEREVPTGGDLRDAVNEVERGLVERALRAHGGNQSRAAKTLGLSRFGLQKKMKRLGISARALAAEEG
ncbi:MAG: sigma 54-interacting transcriptional regulator [Polyangiales bacterium]